MNHDAATLIRPELRGSRVCQAVLLIHAASAVGWWWLTPHGFPWSHPRFWANTVLPLLVVGASAVGCYALEKGKAAIAGPILIAVPIGWTAALIVAWILFPVSSGRFLLPLGGIVAAIWLVHVCWSPVNWPRGRMSALVVMLAALAGGSAPWSQRAPQADTVPADETPRQIRFEQSTRPRAALVRLSDQLQVLTAEGSVFAKCGHLSVDIAPLLTFETRSPDRCWTIFAPPAERIGPRRKLIRQLVTDNQLLLSYEGDARHMLRVWTDDASIDPGPTGCSIDSYTFLDAPVYSHLNAFSTITIRGHRKLALAFSPCPEVRVDVEPADYPVGRPAKFSYLDAGGLFHVVEANSGEKGPFRELASGSLDRGDALAITLYDEDKPAGKITLSDWASQTSVALSPTAGWGVPMNAIEFLRSGDAADAAVEVWITLAATSVGRGWDSVGHRAGTYRNRVQIEPTPSPHPLP